MINSTHFCTLKVHVALIPLPIWAEGMMCVCVYVSNFASAASLQDKQVLIDTGGL